MLPLFSDYHIHTVYSGHAEALMTVRSVIERADSLGLKSIALTEHAFYDLMSRSNLEQISREIAAVDTNVIVYHGMETDPDYSSPGRLIFEDFNRGELKPVLVGTHAVPGLSVGWSSGKDFTLTEKNKIYSEWFRQMEAMVANPLVDVMAHPGRLLAASSVVTEFSGQVLSDFERLFIGDRQYGVAMEVNENMLGRLSNERLRESYKDVIALALSIGLKISLGSDAHSLDAIGNLSGCRRLVEEMSIKLEDLYSPGIM
jgi:HisJ family histidinol phosphate phosphatase